jgi:DNA invertase Pin-like site-specific DNA recombinase
LKQYSQKVILMASFENARMLIGYARVSTDDQSLSLQRDALTKVGCKRIFTDKASGTPTQRPSLAYALSHLRKGDSLVVWSMRTQSHIKVPVRRRAILLRLIAASLPFSPV